MIDYSNHARFPQPHKLHNPFHMQRHNSLLPCLRLQEPQRDLRIHKPVLREHRRAERMLEDVIRRLDVRVPVGEISPETVPRQILDGGITEAGGQLVRKAVAVVSVAAPAGSIVPTVSPAGSVDVNGDEDGVLDRPADLTGKLVGPPDTLLQGDILLFRHQQLGIVATKLEVFHDGAGNPTVVLVLPETSVRRAFARGIDPVAIVN